MANVLGICVGVGILVIIIAIVIIVYWRLIAYRRDLRRRYGRRAGEEPPCWCYDALPMCEESEGPFFHAQCPCLIKYEPDPNEPPAAAILAAKTDDTSRVPEIGDQPPPTYHAALRAPLAKADPSTEQLDDVEACEKEKKTLAEKNLVEEKCEKNQDQNSSEKIEV